MPQEMEPIQTELDWILGSPEGRKFGAPGVMVIDALSGDWWRKTTYVYLNTGWVKFGSAGSGGDVWRYWEDANTSDAPPPNPDVAVERRFFNGDPPVVWVPPSGPWL